MRVSSEKMDMFKNIGIEKEDSTCGLLFYFKGVLGSKTIISVKGS